MRHVNLDDLTWRPYSKTRPLKFKHVTALMADLSVAASILVRTLEGDQRIQEDTMVCVGVEGELWQQSPKDLFKKYDVRSVGSDGWFVGTPKPGNIVDACCVEDAEFTVKGLWGEDDGDGGYFQRGVAGDWVLRNRENPSDVWIVKGRIFRATYERAEVRDSVGA
jgi:hypothetical protein